MLFRIQIEPGLIKKQKLSGHCEYLQRNPLEIDFTIIRNSKAADWKYSKTGQMEIFKKFSSN